MGPTRSVMATRAGGSVRCSSWLPQPRLANASRRRRPSQVWGFVPPRSGVVAPCWRRANWRWIRIPESTQKAVLNEYAMRVPNPSSRLLFTGAEREGEGSARALVGNRKPEPFDLAQNAALHARIAERRATDGGAGDGAAGRDAPGNGDRALQIGVASGSALIARAERSHA